ncbi:3-deoxy-manno-octulosonate cytidylyltransferase [Colwellia hornerae]|uniref:3-deoxy-manno-octulosonate cytidylyltransferase n=1 Tax=Colwellia hornerae TaxID=89402 RepID=A0A5C6QKP3_9GAMM|nr:3-deoxy-manno-octulosonate cytidylyltransferase [Colwellia hornerae]TWX54057.1 3-deoxy-manno-octulosonate cytidylyltransferase [Colwellia hornerae]TWX60832.1 3-deoxy-manno-octulosonate cytidylyltransferase [Colwellia hornerae]TWX69162.1 3-deoxy-manno-octulosonate cytidylyltransferase [Colwellia hornerae]
MKKYDHVIIIPARYKSSRFPGKPLAQIKGKSMIQRVWERCCLAVTSDIIFVATDDERIAEHCKELGIQIIMTSKDCMTGTDRLFDASKKIDAITYINVQGDEPLLDPQDIIDVIEMSKREPNNIVNAMCKINSETDFRSSTIPKVVTRPDGRLLYMSRGAIPTSKTFEFKAAYKQVCIYALPKNSLKDFASVEKKTSLEEIEDIEILRFLELGYEVSMIEVSSASIAVDIPEDVLRVEAALNEMS